MLTNVLYVIYLFIIIFIMCWNSLIALCQVHIQQLLKLLSHLTVEIIEVLYLYARSHLQLWFVLQWLELVQQDEVDSYRIIVR